MGAFLVNFVQLAILTLLGIHAACRLLKYPLGHDRQLIGAGAFAGLYSLPLGPLVHVISPIALYFLLKEPEAQHEGKSPLPVVLLTYLFTGVATLILLKLTHPGS